MGLPLLSYVQGSLKICPEGAAELAKVATKRKRSFQERQKDLAEHES